MINGILIAFDDLNEQALEEIRIEVRDKIGYSIDKVQMDADTYNAICNKEEVKE